MTPRVTVRGETICCPAGTYPGWNRNAMGCFRYQPHVQDGEKVTWCVPWRYDPVEQQCKAPFYQQNYRPRYNYAPNYVDEWPKIEGLIHEKQRQYMVHSE
jgi:hypothetical protein